MYICPAMAPIEANVRSRVLGGAARSLGLAKRDLGGHAETCRNSAAPVCTATKARAGPGKSRQKPANAHKSLQCRKCRLSWTLVGFCGHRASRTAALRAFGDAALEPADVVVTLDEVLIGDEAHVQ